MPEYRDYDYDIWNKLPDGSTEFRRCVSIRWAAVLCQVSIKKIVEDVEANGLCETDRFVIVPATPPRNPT